MEGFADWDLLAVVRSCCTATATATTTSAVDVHPSPPPPPPVKEEPCFHLPTPAPPTPPSSSSSSSSELLFAFPTTLFDPPTASFFGGQQDLQDVCKPKSICTTNSTNFHPNSSTSSSLTSSVSSSSSSSVIARKSFGIGEQPELRRLIRPSQVVFGAAPASTSPAQRTKKRKNLVKKVFHVPAEGLSNDMWAWRKYGQKPIKGSPYPRGYYRCSSSKGCLARKQVERNRSDPTMFIVTYTAEHNHPMPTHRNSLAGSTRQKSADVPSQDQPTCSSPSAASLSPPMEKSESKTECDDLIKEDEDNDMGLSDLILNDDFYVGFEKIDADECFSDHFSPPMEPPWLADSSSPAAAAGGS